VVDTFFNLYPGVVTVSDTGRWTARFFNAPTGADMHLVVSFVFNGHVIAATALGLFGTAPATGQPGGPWSVRAAAHEAPPRNRSRKKKGGRGRKGAPAAGPPLPARGSRAGAGLTAPRRRQGRSSALVGAAGRGPGRRRGFPFSAGQRGAGAVNLRP